ncbi:hypothetical protein MBLNU459_g4958t1 [Dothideomycetes sp. NU459]
MAQHNPYGSHQQHGYPSVSTANSGVLLSHHQPSSMLHQQVSQGMPPSPRMKLEQAPLQRPPTTLSMSHSASSGPQNSPISSMPPSSTNGQNSNAAPGPIPATTPLVVRQDQNGVQWIAFEYSRDRVKMEYTIRCDVESVQIDDLSAEFKTANCVYPRACQGKDQYKGNRLHYESECNAVGWALANLNPMLREKRGLIQRAVDSWRNSNQDPRLRSRRVRRQAKINVRKAQMGTTPHLSGPAVAGAQGPNSMIMGQPRPPPMGVAAGQLHHHHSSQDSNGAVGGEDVSGMFHM